MSRQYSCTNCGNRHAPPTGRKCKFQDDGTEETAAEKQEDLAKTLLNAVQGIQQSLATVTSRLDKLETGQLPTQDTRSDPDSASDGVQRENTTSNGHVTARDLRRDTRLQRDVRARMADLRLLNDTDGNSSDEDTPATSKRKCDKLNGKSGRSRTADEVISQAIDWPHYHVYRGPERKPAKYEDLTIAEFTFGYLASLSQHHHDDVTRKVMLGHLQELMQDAMDYPWESVRNYHAIVLHQQEMARLTWADHQRIQQLRLMYVTRAAPQNAQGGPVAPRFCLAYQTGRCSQPRDHASNKGPVKHICAFCFLQQKGQFPHPEQECRRKQRATPATTGKNDD